MHVRVRSGSVLAAAVLLCLLVLMGIASLSFLTSGDVSSSVALARELKATYLAESIATQVEARTSRHPWIDRFWLVEAQEAGTYTPGSGIGPSVAFDATTGHVDLSGDTLDSDSYDFTGLVKDLSDSVEEYRIYVEVTHEARLYAFSWDKRYQESLLGGLNRDTTRLDKNLDDLAANGPETDQLLDNVKSIAETTPENDIEQQFKDLLDRLREDNDTVETAAGVPPEPEGVPEPAPVPAPQINNDPGGQR